MTIFNNLEYQNLCRDYDTIIKLNTNQDDKLAVKEGVLEISKGGFLQAPTRTVKNLIFGGYNRVVVTEYLEDLTHKTKKFVEALLADPENIKNSPLQVKQYAKKIKEIARNLSSIEYEYRNGSLSCLQSNEISKRLSRLYDQFSEISKLLKKELKTVNIPFQKTPIDFDERPIRLDKIKLRMPKGQTPEDVLRLVENAEKQIVPTWKRVCALGLIIMTSVLTFIPLQLLTLAKWVIWNPIEFIAKGKVTTENPERWWTGSMESLWRTRFSSDPKLALERYTTQLLRASVVSEKHVEAFSKLSKYVKKVDLLSFQIGSSDFTELMSFVDQNPRLAGFVRNKNNLGQEATEAMKQLLGRLDGKLVRPFDFQLFLKTHHLQLKWIDDPNFNLEGCSDGEKNKFNGWKAQFVGNEENAQERLSHFLKTVSLDESLEEHKRIPHITLTNLCNVIEIAAKNPKCREIDVSPDCKNFPQVIAAINSSGFKQKSEKDWAYKR